MRNNNFILAVVALGIIGVIYSIYFIIKSFASGLDMVSIVLAFVMAIAFNFYTLRKTKNSQMTAMGAMFFALMIVIGKEVACIVALLCVFIVSIINKYDTNTILFNTFQTVISILISGFAYDFINDLPRSGIIFTSIRNISGLLIALIVYSLLDILFVNLFVSTQEEMKEDWNWKEIWPYYTSIVPIGIFIALLWRLNFPFSCIFIIIPLYLIDRILSSIKLHSFMIKYPKRIQDEANQKVEEIIQNTEQFKKEIEKKNREMEILLQTSQVLSKTMKLEETNEVIRDMIQKLLSCQTCILFVIKPEAENQLEAETVSGPYTDFVLTLKNFPITPVETIAGWVAAEKKPCLITDTETQNSPPPMMKYERSQIAVPMLSQDQCIGVIYVGQQKANSYNHDDLNLLSTLANHAAISIINAQLYEKTHNLATTDGLTGLYTHRTYQEKLEEEIQRAKRYRTNLALIMVDTDHFKEYNDTFGHPEGDILLKDICKLLKSYVRKTDIVCRYGGDEFTIILADLDKKKAIEKAKTIREAIQLRFNQKEVKITASIGVACFPEDAKTKPELIAKVDELLYKSKRGGRNKVSFLE